MTSRLLRNRGDFAYRDERKLDTGLSNPDAVSSSYASSLLHAFSVYESTERAVVE